MLLTRKTKTSDGHEKHEKALRKAGWQNLEFTRGMFPTCPSWSEMTLIENVLHVGSVFLCLLVAFCVLRCSALKTNSHRRAPENAEKKASSKPLDRDADRAATLLLVARLQRLPIGERVGRLAIGVEAL